MKHKAPDSTAIKNMILHDLQSVSQKNLYTYNSVVSTQEFFKQPTLPLNESFKKTLEAISGNYSIVSNFEEACEEINTIINRSIVYCNNDKLQSQLSLYGITSNADNEYARTSTFSITTCEALSTRTASVIVSSQQIEGRRAIAAAEYHIVIAYSHQLYADLPEAFNYLEEKFGANYPSQITVITGPSRTADIEKTLVLGAHGPKKLHVFIIANN